MRAEILAIGTSARNILIQTVIFVGVLLTATGALLSIHDKAVGDPVKYYKWPLWAIAVTGAITCFTFLRIYVGSHAGTINAARYYRDVLAGDLKKILHAGHVLQWEGWLRDERVSRRGFRNLLRRPGEELIATPIFIAIVGIIAAMWGVAIILHSEGGVRCLAMRNGAGAAAWGSIFLLLFIFGSGLWANLRMWTLEREFDGVPTPLRRLRESVVASARHRGKRTP